VILVIPATGTVYAQTTNEIDIQTGAGSSANAACVSTNNCFTPNPLSVTPGTTVTWTNNDLMAHTVTSGKVSDSNSGSLFDSGLISGTTKTADHTFQFTFANAGTYDYYCTIHPWMTGQVIVGSSGTVPTPQPTQPTVSLTTDRQSYNQGDTIIISGKVIASAPYSAVTLRIFNSHGDLISVGQILPSSDGSFVKTILITGPLWTDAGTYAITYQYGSLGAPSNQTFYYNGGNGQSIVTSPSITTGADKSSYSYGDTITISGVVQSVQHVPVSISILDPNNNVVQITQVNANTDGTYVDSIRITGPYWKSSGTYTIKVQYGLPNITAQTTFAYATNNQSTNAIYPLQFGGQTYNIPYTIQGGTIINMQFVPTHLSTLEIAVMTTTDGSITVTLPRSLIDAKTTSGQDAPFATLIDGAEVTPQSESANNSFRNITIQYLQGDSKIDITGTQIASSSTSNSNNSYLGCSDCNNTQQIQLTSGGTLKVGLSTDPINPNTSGQTQLKINFMNKQDSTQQHIDYKVSVIQGSNQIFGIPLTHTAPGSVSIPIQFQNSGTYQIIVEVDGILFQPIPSEFTTFSLQVKAGQNNSSYPPTSQPTSQPTSPTPSTQQDIQDINQAKDNQTIAAEVNIGNDKTETKSIDNSVSVQTTNTSSDSFGVKVSAPDQTGPKVIVFNLNATTINVTNLKDLGVMYDGKAISPAPNMDAILHAKSTDNPSFAIVVTQSGVQVLVLVPHFSTHTITLTNMSKVIPAVPEFGPIVGMITIISLIGSILTTRRFFKV